MKVHQKSLVNKKKFYQEPAQLENIGMLSQTYRIK